MEDKQIIELYFARNEKAIFESQQKYGAFCRSIAWNLLSNREDSEECDGTLYNSKKCDNICRRVDSTYSCISFKCNDNCTINTAVTCGKIN